MTIEIVRTRAGEFAFERYLAPIFDNPNPLIFADSEIDMRRQVQYHVLGKIWWLAVDDQDQVYAQGAAWSSADRRHHIECGSNYEHGHRDREQRYWPLVFAARQVWLAQHR